MKVQYVLASKNTVEQKGQEAHSLEQVWSWHSCYLDNVRK